MSTKIYNGARIIGHTLESFLAEVQNIRGAFREASREQLRQAVVNCAFADFDKHHLGLSTKALPQSFIGAAFSRLLDRQNECERSGQRDPFIDYTAEVTVFPVEGQLLAIPYIDNPTLRKLLASQPWWQEYGYWDNVDPEEDVTEAAWQERERLWSLALPDGLAPAQAGYTVTILAGFDGDPGLSDEQLAPHLPTLEERIHLASDWYRELPDDLVLPMAPGRVGATRQEVRQALVEYLKPKLVPELTIPMLRRRV